MNIIPFFLAIVIIPYFILSGGKGREEKKRKIYAIIFTTTCILIAGLRNVAVGSDTYAYYLRFEDVCQMSWQSVWAEFTDYLSLGTGKDVGYTVLQKIFQIISKDYQVFMFAVVTFFYIPVVRYIYKNTESLVGLFMACILLAALFFQFTYTGLRQVIVFGMVILSMKYVEQKKLIKFLIVILIASTIHKSVLIFLPCYFVNRVQSKNWKYFAVILLLPIFFLVRQDLAMTLALASGEERYMMYVDDTTTAGTPVFTALIIFIVAAGIMYREKIDTSYKNSDIITNLTVIALFLTPLTWVDPNLMRLVMYFTLFLPIYFSRVLNAIPRSVRTVAIIGSIVLASILMLKQAAPYAFFWQEMALGDNYL